MVAFERFSIVAASLFETPLAMSWRISVSRADSFLPSGSAGRGGALGAAGAGVAVSGPGVSGTRKCLSRRRASEG